MKVQETDVLSSIRLVRIESAVANQGFPKLGVGGGGRQPPRWGRQPIIWQLFSRKLHENERNWTQRGAHVSGAPLRSANGVVYQLALRIFLLQDPAGVCVLQHSCRNGPIIHKAHWLIVAAWFLRSSLLFCPQSSVEWNFGFNEVH